MAISLSNSVFKAGHTTRVAVNYNCTPVDHDIPHKFKQYDNLKMEKAVEQVCKGLLSGRRAALEYGIPQSTLSDHIRGHVLPGAMSGPKKYLSDTEEDELVVFITKSADIGYAYTVKEIMCIV